MGGIGSDRGIGIAPDVERRHLDGADVGRQPLVGAIPGERGFERLGIAQHGKMFLERGRGHALAEQAVAQAARIVRQQQLAGLGLEERAVMARAMLLVAVFLQQRAAERLGCGRDRMVSEASRSGCVPATPHDTCPPQSWPTRWKRLPS